MALELIDFIKENADWETLLQEEPYFVSVKRKENFALFSYSQLFSDFSIPMVRECRGIILDMNTLTPVCVPFYKFGNYDESYVPDIDWASARVQEKVDGSLIKVWFYNWHWNISTNGTIDANDALIDNDLSPYESFYWLFCGAAKNSGLNFKKLNPQNTYMFELVSPWNRVVVPYTETEIFHIGTRNNITLMECDENIGVQKPKSYGLHTLEECISATSVMPFSEEGYVVVDKDWNRVKIKSPAYVAAHYLKNNGVVTKKRIVEIIRIGESEEFLNYYPEFAESFRAVKNNINNFCANMKYVMETIISVNPLGKWVRKEFSNYVDKTVCPPLLFSWYDGFISTPEEWLWKQTNEKIIYWTERRLSS